MERLITLLREKNSYLEKFYAVNEHELLNFIEGDFEHVEAFYQAREKILDLIRCIDGLIDDENKNNPCPVTAELRAEVEDCLGTKDEWVTLILQQDLQVIEYIEKEKSKIIRELSSTAQAKKAVGAYGKTERLKTWDQLEEKP